MTFFSGTDTNTLELEGASRTHFLSLIVNNEGTYTARLTTCVTRVANMVITSSYDSFTKDNIKMPKQTKTVEYKDILYSPVAIDIEKDYDNQSIINYCKEKTEEIVKIKEQTKTNINTLPSSTDWNKTTIKEEKPVEKQGILFKEDTEKLSDDSLAELLAKKIISGCLTVDNDTFMNIYYYVQNLDSKIEKVYGNIETYKDVMEEYVDLVLRYFVEVDEDDQIVYAHIANGILDYLDTLPYSEALEVIKECVYNYCLEEDEIDNIKNKTVNKNGIKGN